VKEKTDIKTTNTILPILGLVLVLLLSPCKVRNFVQEQLGVPQTEVTNKSKSTLNNSDCSDIELVTNNLAKEKSASQHMTVIAVAFDLAFGLSVFSNNNVQAQGERAYSASAIPFYILYQNFKDFL